MDAKCDEFEGKMLALEKECKEQGKCLSKYCCSFKFLIIFRISVRARNFCSSLNCMKDGSRDNKNHLPSSTSVSSIFSAAKSEVLIPRRKFRFAFFFRTFQGLFFFSSCELFASSSSFRAFKLLCVSRSSM